MRILLILALAACSNEAPSDMDAPDAGGGQPDAGAIGECKQTAQGWWSESRADGVTWHEALAYCEAHNATLNTYGFGWVSLNDREQEGVWVNIDGSPPHSNIMWAEGHPVNNGADGQEDCAYNDVEFDQGGTVSLDCESEKTWFSCDCLEE